MVPGRRVKQMRSRAFWLPGKSPDFRKRLSKERLILRPFKPSAHKKLRLAPLDPKRFSRQWKPPRPVFFHAQTDIAGGRIFSCVEA